jgi:hypothetical protein
VASVQCGKFAFGDYDPQTGNLTFRATLTPAPDDGWVRVFQEYQATERAIGNPARARIQGDAIEFEVPEALAEAAAECVRRCIEKTNQEVATRQARRKRMTEDDQRRVEAERRRLQEKFRDGL